MTTVRANIYAVADRAGVSIATVSRVQRGIGPVSAETRERVLRAIEELRYTPSGSGRALATQRAGAMGIVFPDLSGPYYSEVILGVEEEMVAAGQSLFILGTHGRDRCAELVLDLMSRVDGLIIMGRTVSDEVVRALEGGRVPLALLARPPVDGIPSVRAESLQPAMELTEHLLAHGHEHLAFIGDPASSSDAEERWRGFAQAVGDRARGAVLGRVRRGRGPPCGHPGARHRRHRASVRQRRARARRLPRRPRTPAAHPRRHCHHRVGRHPACAVRLPRLDHRAPAHARAGRCDREAALRAHRGRGARRHGPGQRRSDPRELRL